MSSEDLLNLKLLDSSKTRIRDSYCEMLSKNLFQDVTLICPDGRLGIDKLSLSLLLPEIEYVLKDPSFGCESTLIMLPDYKKVELLHRIDLIVREMDLTLSSSANKNRVIDSLLSTETSLPSNISANIKHTSLNNTINDLLPNAEFGARDEKHEVFLEVGNGCPAVEAIKRENEDCSMEEKQVSQTQCVKVEPDLLSEGFSSYYQTSNQLFVGMTFPDKATMQESIRSYSISNYSPLVIRKSNKNRHMLLRCSYQCPHGIKRKSLSTGIRKANSVNYFTNCPVKVDLNEMEDGSFVIQNLLLQHENHEVSEEQYSKYVINRRLSKDHEDALKAFLTTNPSTKDVAKLLTDLVGFPFKTKDAFNVVTKLKKNKGCQEPS